MATGLITVGADDEVTAISGEIFGLIDQTIGSITANPNFSAPTYSPDGLFIYNNLYHPSGLLLGRLRGPVRHSPKSGRLLGFLGKFPWKLLALGIGGAPPAIRSRKAKL